MLKDQMPLVVLDLKGGGKLCIRATRVSAIELKDGEEGLGEVVLFEDRDTWHVLTNSGSYGYGVAVAMWADALDHELRLISGGW